MFDILQYEYSLKMSVSNYQIFLLEKNIYLYIFEQWGEHPA